MLFQDRLYQPVDNAPLIVFRFFFGLLMCAESWGAILTGWVRRTFVDVQFTFNFIGFDWLQCLVGTQAYAFYFVMGVLGLMIAFGVYYRAAIVAFTIMWGMTYLGQKTQYNNHYYLVWLISIIFCFLPANVDKSLDVNRGRVARRHHHGAWIRYVIITLITIVYIYASVAKWNSDWIQAIPIKYWLSSATTGLTFLDSWLDHTYVHYLFSWFGIFYDALIIPALLFKPTRKLAFIFSIIFHILNSIILKIGIFPYFALSFAVFFFEPAYIRKLFFRQPLDASIEKPIIERHSWRLGFMAVFLAVQLVLPLRHHFISEQVLWTEAGHRKSWRMMLRSRHGKAQFEVKRFDTGHSVKVVLDQFVKNAQLADVKAYPDFMYQMAHRIEDHYKELWDVEDVAVYIDSEVSVNVRPYIPFTDKTFDVTSVKWNYWGRQPWVLPWPENDQDWHRRRF